MSTPMLAGALALVSVQGCGRPSPPPTPAVAAAGVSASSDSPTGPDAIVPASEYLVPDFDQRFTRRVRVVRRGTIRFTLDGPDAGRLYDPQDDDHRAVVAAERPDRVRIIEDEGKFLWMLWVTRADLAKVAVVRTPLALEPGTSPPSRVGVTVDAGFASESIDGVNAYFEHDDGNLEFRGWAPLRAVAEVYEPSERWQSEIPDTRLRPDAVLRVEPAGSELARVTASQWLDVPRVGPDSLGYALVEYRGDDFVARGYVALEDTGPIDGSGSGYGSGSAGYPPRGGIWIDLPPDTCIYWPGVDEPIGIVTARTKQQGARGPDGEWYLRRNTGWGILDFVVRPLDEASPPTTWERCPWK